MSPTAASPTSSLIRSSIAPRPDLGRVAAFLGIALSVTAALSLLVAAGILPTATVGLIVPLAQLSPLLAALLVRRRGEPRREALGLAVPSWRLMLLASLGAVAAFVMVPLARVLIGLGAGAPPLTDPAPVQGLLLAVPSVLLLQALLAIGEETGWRGWLQRELTRSDSGGCPCSSAWHGRCGMHRSSSPSVSPRARR